MANNMKDKNVILGMDLAGDDLAVLCIIVDNETFYFEFNDADLTKATPQLLNRMLFLNSEEPTMYYKSGEKGVTFIRDNKEMIQEHVENIFRQYCNECNVHFIGNIKPIEFVAFSKLLKEINNLKHINIDDDYLSLKSIEKALNVLRITNDKIFGVREREDTENRIVSTKLVESLYKGLIEFKPLI